MTYKDIQVGDVVLVKLSNQTRNLCGGHQLFKMNGQIVEGICLYSDFHKEKCVTTDGITYTSQRMKSKIIKKLGNYQEFASWKAFIKNYYGYYI